MALYRKESVAFNELAPIETSSTASDGVKMQLSGSKFLALSRESRVFTAF